MVLKRCVAKFVTDSRRDPETEKSSIRRAGIISQYVVPLLTKDMRIGTMQVHMGECDERPDLACRILDALGAHLSLAISRFRALDRLSEANDAIMSNARTAIASEVATAMIHQLSHEVDEFNKRLDVKLKQKLIRDSRVALELLEELKREIPGWKRKLDRPLKYIIGGERRRVCSVNGIVKEALEYWYETISGRKCSVRYGEGTKRVMVDIHPSHLREVLSCLILNALQAHARLIEIDVQKSLEYCGAEEKEMCAVLRVRDDGDGIPMEFADEVFKQGFTTKRKVGTGVGLFVVKRLVGEMSGEVDLESYGKSAGGRATVFKVIIPAESGDS
jgi:signal transduction histidine kinase